VSLETLRFTSPCGVSAVAISRYCVYYNIVAVRDRYGAARTPVRGGANAVARFPADLPGDRRHVCVAPARLLVRAMTISVPRSVGVNDWLKLRHENRPELVPSVALRHERPPSA
jgi:hypothetical protein